MKSWNKPKLLHKFLDAGAWRIVFPGLIAVLSLYANLAVAAQKVTVTATEFRFEPQTVTVQSGEEVILMLRNSGVVAHNIAVPELDAESATVQSQGQTELSLTVPDKVGEYRIICTVPGHEAAGMVGILVVEVEFAPEQAQSNPPQNDTK